MGRRLIPGRACAGEADEYRSYDELDDTNDYDRETDNRSDLEYVGVDSETINTVEGFFPQLKRAIGGPHITMSKNTFPSIPKNVSSGSTIVRTVLRCFQTFFPSSLRRMPNSGVQIVHINRADQFGTPLRTVQSDLSSSPASDSLLWSSLLNISVCRYAG